MSFSKNKARHGYITASSKDYCWRIAVNTVSIITSINVDETCLAIGTLRAKLRDQVGNKPVNKRDQ